MEELKQKGYSIITLDCEDDFNNMYDDICMFCEKAVNDIKSHQNKRGIDLSHTILNMTTNKWEEIRDGMLYRIYKHKKYSCGKGCFNFIYFDGNIVGSSGGELWNNNVMSLAKRSFVLTPHRRQNLITRMFMPTQINWFDKNIPDINVLIATFNTYLRGAVFNSTLKLKKRILDGPWNFWPTWEIYPRVVMMNYVPQFLVYYCRDKKRTNEEIRKLLGIEEAEDAHQQEHIFDVIL